MRGTVISMTNPTSSPGPDPGRQHGGSGNYPFGFEPARQPHPAGYSTPRPPLPRQPMTNPPPAPARRNADRPRPGIRPWIAFLLGLSTFLLGLTVGHNLGTVRTGPSVPSTPSVTSVASPTKIAAPPAASTPAASVPTKLNASFSDGAWTAGVDIEPGVYRVRDVVSSGACFWTIGKPGAALPDNGGSAAGGRPTVRLSAGQEINTASCGQWIKQ